MDLELVEDAITMYSIFISDRFPETCHRRKLKRFLEKKFWSKIL
jgi:hypothetical protein